MANVPTFNPLGPPFDLVPASATTGAEGTVQLAGDLGGTSAAPTVLGVTSWNGWIPDTNAWAYNAATSGSMGVIHVTGDCTGYIQPGTRVKYTQTTVKYGIVVQVNAYGADESGKTRIYVYGGTDYTTANAAISATSFSHSHAPMGFNPSIAKWTVLVTDSSGRFQSNPDNTTKYNPGSLSVTIPVGTWDLSWSLVFRAQSDAAQTAFNAFFAMSDTNNGLTDSTGQTIFDKIKGDYVQGGASSTLEIRLPGYTESDGYVLTAATTYYFMAWSTSGSSVMNSIGFDNGNTAMKFKARCAFL